MLDQPPLTLDAVEVFVASLRQRSVQVNTIKSYAHDLRLFAQSVPAELPAVTVETIFEQAQTALIRQGVALPEGLWSHLSPFHWTHIQFNGTYHFPEMTLKKAFVRSTPPDATGGSFQR